MNEPLFLGEPPPPRRAEQCPGVAVLPPVLRIFWAASIVAFLLALWIAWLQARRGDPFWEPLGYQLFPDLLENMPTFALVHTPAFWSNNNPLTPTVAYPPFASVLMGLIYATRAPVGVYIFFAMGSLILACVCVRHALRKERIDPWVATLFPLTVVLVSFPIMALLQRGNIELFLWIFAASGTWAFLRGYDNAAAVLWALAASAKLYPIILLALLLPRRRYGAASLGIASFATVSLTSMAYLGPTIRAAWVGSLHAVFGYQAKRVLEWDFQELVANHSLFTWVKTVAVILSRPPAELTLPYYACGGVVFAWIFFGRLQKMPVGNQLLGVSVFMVLLPTISYSHTLVHLYAPWLVLVMMAVRAGHERVTIPGLSLTILLFLPVFACFTLFSFKNMLLFGGLMQGACLVVLLLCAVTFPFAEPVPG